MGKSRYTIEYVNPEPTISKSSTVRPFLYFILGSLITSLVTVIAYSILSNTSLVTIVTNPQQVIDSINQQGTASSDDAEMLANVKEELVNTQNSQVELKKALADKELEQKSSSEKSLKTDETIKTLTAKIKLLEKTAKELSVENTKINKTANQSLIENKKIAESASSLINENKEAKLELSTILADKKQDEKAIKTLEDQLKLKTKKIETLVLEKNENQKTIKTLAFNNKEFKQKNEASSLKTTKVSEELKQTANNNILLLGNVKELKANLQQEKESNASLLYQLSLQKTESIRLSKAIKKQILSTTKLLGKTATEPTKPIDQAETFKLQEASERVVKILDGSGTNNKLDPLEKPISKNNSSQIDSIMAVMGNVNTSPPVSLETSKKKDYVIEVESDSPKTEIQKAFQKELDELSQ